MKTMEERLWSYIDGTGTDEERTATEKLIAQDENIRRQYEGLLNLDQEFAKMDLDEPPMAFTYNVMEAIRAEYAQKPLKAGINKRIIRVISGFFIVSILVLLLVVLSTLHLTPVKFSVHLPNSLKVPDIKNYLTGPVIQGFIFFDAILGLFLFDAYLRRKNVSKQGSH